MDNNRSLSKRDVDLIHYSLPPLYCIDATELACSQKWLSYLILTQCAPFQSKQLSLHFYMSSTFTSEINIFITLPNYSKYKIASHLKIINENLYFKNKCENFPPIHFVPHSILGRGENIHRYKKSQLTWLEIFKKISNGMQLN